MKGVAVAKEVGFEDGRFTVTFPYDSTLVGVVKGIPGHRWDKDGKVWTFPADLVTAGRLWEVLGSKGFSFRMEATEANRRLRENLEASRATTTTKDFPRPEGLAYRPFQGAGIGFMHGKRYVLNADPPGTGKTIQTAGVINANPTLRRILVVCKAVGKINWQRELEKWLVRPLSSGIVWGSDWPEGNPDIVIINYEILGRHHQKLREREWDLMVLDECQKIKNQRADRTGEVYGDSREAKSSIPARHIIWLTGSPTMNGRPIEMWPMLRKAGIFTNWVEYVTRYCDGKKVKTTKKWETDPLTGRKVFAGWNEAWDTKGASNLEELQAILRSSFMIRRSKAEVLPELDEISRQVIEVPGSASLLEEERRVLAGHEGKLAELRTAVEKAKVSDSEEDYAEAVKRLRMGIMVAMQEMSEVRHEMAVAMLPTAIEFIRDILEDEDKLVVFGHHHDVIDGIAKAFPGCVKVRGGVTPKQRQTAIDRFQTDPDVHLFVGSFGAAGDTITLHAASRAVFTEDSWVPEEINQAESRLNRMGQKQAVYIQYLVMQGSIGATIMKRRVHKAGNTFTALDKAFEAPDLPESPIPEPDGSASRQELIKEALRLTDEDIARIHQDLKVLAARCDGAQARDGQGFNKIDARLGKWLAAAPRLSPKQAAMARRMLVKYKKQLEG